MAQHLATDRPTDSGLSGTFEVLRSGYVSPRLNRPAERVWTPMPLAPIPAYRDVWAGNPDTDKNWSK